MNSYTELLQLLKNNGYGVVEGAEATRAKIKEIGKNDRYTGEGYTHTYTQTGGASVFSGASNDCGSNSDAGSSGDAGC